MDALWLSRFIIIQLYHLVIESTRKESQFTLAAVAAAMSAGLTLSAQAADKITVAMDSQPGHIRAKTIRKFAALVEERTGGSVTFEVFDSNSLYAQKDALRAVARGDAGMAVMLTPYVSRVVADFNLFDLPMFNGMSPDERSAMLGNGLGDALAETLADTMGVVVPGDEWWSMGRVLLFSTNKPMNEFADLKGMQIRIPGGAALVMRMNAIGAKAISMSGADTPLALQQGVVDATMGGPDSAYNNQYWDMGVKHAFWDGGIVGYLVPVINKDNWASMTEAEQKIFADTWNEIAIQERVQVSQEEEKYLALLAEHGVGYVAAPADDVAKANEAMMEIQDAMIKKLGISQEIIDVAVKARP